MKPVQSTDHFTKTINVKLVRVEVNIIVLPKIVKEPQLLTQQLLMQIILVTKLNRPIYDMEENDQISEYNSFFIRLRIFG